MKTSTPSTFTAKSVKGQSREVRKLAHEIGIAFPTTGPCHLETVTKPHRQTVPQDSSFYEVGELQVVKGAYGDAQPLFGSKSSFLMPAAAQVTAPPVMTSTASTPIEVAVYHRKTTGTRANGKPYTTYRAIKNPKAGEKYYLKVNGQWTEVDYSKHVATADVA